jgi:hypothetical protein
MPEASINKHRCLALREVKIGPAWEMGTMKFPSRYSETAKHRSENALRAAVAPVAYRGHHLRPLGFRKNVHRFISTA